MSLTPFPVDQFGGLNLLDDPTDLGMSGAVDLSNVEFDRSGRIRTRYGITTAATPTATAATGIVGFEQTSGTRQVVVAIVATATSKLIAYPVTSNTPTATQTVGGTGFSPARFGNNTGGEYLYVANGSDSVWRWDGAVFTQPAGMPKASYAAVTPVSNRLVVAVFQSTSATMANGTFRGSRVGFSDAGLPETWTYGAGPPETGNFVDLTPGDGSNITGLVTWGTFTFAFKRERFFVFTGEGTQSDGTPKFVYRPVEGYGATTPPVTGDEGVYFYDGTAIWLTTGGTPARISRPIEAFLNGSVSVAGVTAGVLGNPILGYSQGRLYVTQGGTGTPNVLTLVYDPKASAWTVYTQSLGGIAGISTMRVTVASVIDKRFTCFIHQANPPIISYLDPTTTADGATAIPWSYTTGYSNAGGYFRARIISSGERKRHFKTDIEGSGTVTHQVLALNARPGDLADPGGSVALGTAPAIARGSRRRGVRGVYFAHKLSGTGPAVVSGLTYWLANVESDT